MSKFQYKYQLITCWEGGERIEHEFTSDFDDCDLDPYGDHVPFAVGSNQFIRAIDK